MFVMNYNGPNCNSDVTTPVVSVRSYCTLQGRPARPDTAQTGNLLRNIPFSPEQCFLPLNDFFLMSSCKRLQKMAALHSECQKEEFLLSKAIQMEDKKC